MLSRPQTAGVSKQMGSEQVNMLKAMMHVSGPGRAAGQKAPKGHILAPRPKTAATSSAVDEKRIKDKLSYLDNVLDKLDDEVLKATDHIDIDFFRGMRNPALAEENKDKKGVKLTKKMVLENALLCDDLEDVTTLMLRDKNIDFFDDNLEDLDDDGNCFKLTYMCNLECLMASHNMIKDINGILQLTTLVELNLSYNMITDVK